MDIVSEPDGSGDALIDEDYGDMAGTVAWNEWRLKRHGENVLFGEGILMIDIPDAVDEGYELIVGDNVTWSNHDGDAYVLLSPAGVDDDGSVHFEKGTFQGLAYGTVDRKMIPAASPDVTAVRLEVAEDFEGIEQ